MNAEESRGVGRESRIGLRERESEECSTRTLSAEEQLRRAQLENESKTTTLNEYRVLVSNLQNKLEVEELNGLDVLQELEERGKILFGC